MPLLPYQHRWVDDRSPIKVWEKSRRIGATWAEAGDAVVEAAKKKGGSTTYYVGYNKEMALEFIDEAASWTRLLNKAASVIEQFIVEDEGRDILAYRIKFSTGNQVVALSSRPANLRGKQGIAVIDEAAFHEDLAGLIKAALALTMWGGRVHILSTHFGAANPFNELVNDIRAGRRRGFSLHRTTLDDALGEGLYRTICQELGREWTAVAEAQWRADLVEQYGDDADEELFVIPSQMGGLFLPAALVESRMQPGIPVLRAKGPHAFDELEPALTRACAVLHSDLMSFFGEDFGRSGDLTVIWPLQVEESLMRRTPFVVELRDVPYEEQRRILFHVLDRLPHFVSGAMDATGNGGYLAEVAGQRYGAKTDEHDGRIDPVMLTIDWYREHMPKYKAALEDAKIILPQSAAILADHQLLRMTKGVAKPDDRRTRDGEGGGQRHGDSAVAAALAYYATFQGIGQYQYRSVTPAVSQREFRAPATMSAGRTEPAGPALGRGRGEA